MHSQSKHGGDADKWLLLNDQGDRLAATSGM